VIAALAMLQAANQHVAWPPSVMARHLAAARNCASARAVGLAPARRGEPGYWWHLDADNDGIACEPWSGRSASHRSRLRSAMLNDRYRLIDAKRREARLPSACIRVQSP
jgi:hypothetical protein